MVEMVVVLVVKEDPYLKENLPLAELGSGKEDSTF